MRKKRPNALVREIARHRQPILRRRQPSANDSVTVVSVMVMVMVMTTMGGT